MKNFIEKILHQNVLISSYEKLDQFSLFFQKSVVLNNITIGDMEAILVKPIENMNLSMIRHIAQEIGNKANRVCIFYFLKLSSYTHDRLIEEGISFVWEEKEVYIPCFGYYLKQNKNTVLSVNQISFLTQKFLLKALYEEWDHLNASDVAKKLEVSKMSASRIFSEIESLGIPVLNTNGKRKVYRKQGTKKEIWDTIHDFLRNPVIKEFHLEQDMDADLLKSEMTALSSLSMLEDRKYPVYAVLKRDVKEKGIHTMSQIPYNESPGCIVQEVGYCISFHHDLIDPLSVVLMFQDNKDPRIEKAMEKMLEEYVW